MKLAADDILALQHMIIAYGHIIDSRQWERLRELFTEDLVFVPYQADMSPTTSLSELVARWSAPEYPHPVGHHETNVLIEPQWTARCTSRGRASRSTTTAVVAASSTTSTFAAE